MTNSTYQLEKPACRSSKSDFKSMVHHSNGKFNDASSVIWIRYKKIGLKSLCARSFIIYAAKFTKADKCVYSYRPYQMKNV